MFAGPFVKFRREEPVPGLGGAVVACRVCRVFAGGELGERETTRRTLEIDDNRRCENHTHAGFGRETRGLLKDRKQKFGQEERAETIGAHVRFVALDAGAANRGHADTRIIPKNVEAGFLSEEGGSAGWDRGEVAEIEM